MLTSACAPPYDLAGGDAPARDLRGGQLGDDAGQRHRREAAARHGVRSLRGVRAGDPRGAVLLPRSASQPACIYTHTHSLQEEVGPPIPYSYARNDPEIPCTHKWAISVDLYAPIRLPYIYARNDSDACTQVWAIGAYGPVPLGRFITADLKKPVILYGGCLCGNAWRAISAHDSSYVHWHEWDWMEIDARGTGSCSL